ncbi:GNAT family N-acetyltransferase [Rhizobiaceae bacterium n13]|uniref:Aminoglycoside N(6')-acetyltransferase type 1 n=1 Tax=Ferirhizobium litorale TaxID=2927786 RepID=A0AAE3Q9W7_9HYPH|nr:aminoglycoside 6'-N-acetyltransferase [Fererhizobium litorale]MDI7860808.1 GNAT family N-acetyltransferase [Fererhizobium litorale]MDI7920956.1 GNAT family N-acetyltransferase [Fererhizobium litorale]
MRVLLVNPDMLERWERMRQQLWPDTPSSIHWEEMEACLANPDRQAAFLCEDDAGVVAGFAEASLRSDYVNGCETSPVAFLEGIFVLPSYRRRGVARALVIAVERWAMSHSCRELASDTDLANLTSQSLHASLGFEETERVVYFRKELSETSREN